MRKSMALPKKKNLGDTGKLKYMGKWVDMVKDHFPKIE